MPDKTPLMLTGFMASPEIIDRLKGTAKECGVSVSEFCRDAVTRALDELDALSI